jgi:hemerythrin
MALINWESSFSVNVAEIDAQHQKIVGFINDLNDAMKQGKGKDALGSILNELINYTATHFKYEEQYFEKFGYAGTAEHKQHHAKLVSEVIAFRDGFQSGKLGVTVEVLTFLVNWLKNHILVEDKKYTSCFNSNGLK